MTQAGSLFALRGLSLSSKEGALQPIQTHFHLQPHGFFISNLRGFAFRGENTFSSPMSVQTKPGSGQSWKKKKHWHKVGLSWSLTILVVGQPLLPILSIIFVVLLRGCVVLCLFVVLACCVQSRKPGVTIWELPDPTHLENKPIGRRCSPLPEERERVCSWECILVNLYWEYILSPAKRLHSLRGEGVFLLAFLITILAGRHKMNFPSTGCLCYPG